MGDETVSRKLHTGTSTWVDTSTTHLPHQKTPAKRFYDVIVIGSGISGALSAYTLADGIRSVLVLDKRTPVTGSTLASTAMLQHEIDVSLTDLSTMIGAEKAARAWRRSAKAVETLKDIILWDNIDCDFQVKDTIYLSGPEMGYRAMKRETALRCKQGLDAQYLTGSELKEKYGIDRTAAIVSKPSASCNPAQLTAGLLKRALAKGAELVSPLEVTDILATQEEVSLRLSDKRKLTCRHLVIATGYEVLRKLKNENHSIISTWALTAKPKSPVPTWMDQTLVWEADDPYLYFRLTRDGYLIAGGEDEEFKKSHYNRKKLHEKTDKILRKIESLLGIEFNTPDYRWAAPFGTTMTGLPLIGAVPKEPNVYTAMGFGGNGITFSMIAAEIITKLIEGETDEDQDIFALN